MVTPVTLLSFLLLLHLFVDCRAYRAESFVSGVNPLLPLSRNRSAIGNLRVNPACLGCILRQLKNGSIFCFTVYLFSGISSQILRICLVLEDTVFQIQIQTSAVVRQVNTTAPVTILSVRTPLGKRHAVGIRIQYCVSWDKICGAVQTLLPSAQHKKWVVMRDSAHVMADILQPIVSTWNVVLLAQTAATDTHGGG